ncbi:hypothetical protein F0562_009912 [Nyssa sinensis]|uniref:C2H2-type domain-containing protein n=1 Tax=Nyssa sinensis TaxID=561372 RepID=A0A5J4ZZJ7_9ASTE|nr:hypothetical protein F0562_009912 [Nyssa sinensis]
MDDDEEKQSQPIKKGQLSGSPETPVSDDGKPLIKLKMPKVQGGVREEEISGKVQSRVCEVCDKTFSSGKALGGHMRVHVQNKEVSPKKLKTSHQPVKKQQRKQIINASDSNDTTNVRGGDGNSKPTCSLCAKNFPSMKSLFGHMRCHPEREWRGIQPPPAAKNSPLSSVSDAVPGKTDDRIDSDAATTEIPVVDLTRSLTRWSVTGMRGRKAYTASSAVSSAEEERLHDAVQYLMKLAHGNSLESGLTHKHIHEEYEATNSNSLNNNQVSESKKLRIEESPVGYRSDYPVQKLKIDERGSTDDAGNSGVNSEYIEKSKGKSVLETVYIPENSVTLSLNCQWVNTDWHREDDYKNLPDDDELESRPMVMIKNKKRKKLKLRDLESVQEGNPVDHQFRKPVGYKCSTCNKCFPTHQALGGHRSSHNKVRNFQNTIDESSSAAAGDEQHAYPIINETKESEGAACSKMVEMSTHQCKICKKTFPTGQALGGHKRCHWIAPAVEAPSSQVTSPEEPGESSQMCRKVLDFDLNEPAAMEEYEQVLAASRTRVTEKSALGFWP